MPEKAPISISHHPCWNLKSNDKKVVQWQKVRICFNFELIIHKRANKNEQPEYFLTIIYGRHITKKANIFFNLNKSLALMVLWHWTMAHLQYIFTMILSKPAYHAAKWVQLSIWHTFEIFLATTVVFGTITNRPKRRKQVLHCLKVCRHQSLFPEIEKNKKIKKRLSQLINKNK